MDQSFDPTQLTLEKAAELVAIRARLGVSRSMREKQSNAMTGALIGGGLGLGTGLVSTLMSKRKKKQWLRNALLGSLLGAGVGGAAGYGMSQLGAASGQGSSTQAKLDELRKLMESNGAGGKGPNESFWNTGPLLSALGNRVSSDFDPSTIQDPTARARAEQLLGELQTEGIDPSQAGIKQPGSGLTNMVSNAPKATEYGLYGMGLGHLYDMAAQRRAQNAQATPQEIVNSSRANPKAFNEAVGQPLAEQIRQSQPVRERTGAKMTPAQATVRGRTIPLPQFRIPFTGTTREAFRGETAPGSGTMRDVTVSPHQMDVLRETTRSNRPTRERGKGGKGWGTAIGVLSGLFAPQAQNPDVNP